MNKETINLIIRHILTAVGSFLIGKAFLGITIDAVSWESIVGFAITLAGLYWSIREKNTGIEIFQGVVRHAFTVFGGLLVASGRLTAGELETYLGLALALFAAVQSWTSRKKVAAVKTGQIPIQQLKGKS